MVQDTSSNVLKVKELADELIKFLNGSIHDTKTRTEWSTQNFGTLKHFIDVKTGKSSEYECWRTWKGSPEEGPEREFLWDFVVYWKNNGIVLVAESEWNSDLSEVWKDFRKLLYASCPLKVMICRLDKHRNPEETAIELRDSLYKRMKEDSSRFVPGDVFVLYCVYFADRVTRSNRDIAFSLQVSGVSTHVPLTTEQFERVAG